MRFLFKTDYGQDIKLAKHGGQVFWYSLLCLWLLAAPWLLSEYLLAQLTFDFVPAAIRERLIDGVSARTLSGLVAPVYALDGALAPIGLLVAFAATQGDRAY